VGELEWKRHKPDKRGHIFGETNLHANPSAKWWRTSAAIRSVAMLLGIKMVLVRIGCSGLFSEKSRTIR
jgi:uncharacterized membrane protein YkgB